jgi:hypothetical protein
MLRPGAPLMPSSWAFSAASVPDFSLLRDALWATSGVSCITNEIELGGGVMFLYALKRLGWAAALMAVFILLLSFLALPVEARSCEQALLDCWDDYSWMALAGAVFCGTGYLFCKKYVRE